jgi:hypothetical protein
MINLAFTYHQPCGCNIAGQVRRAAGQPGGPGGKAGGAASAAGGGPPAADRGTNAALPASVGGPNKLLPFPDPGTQEPPPSLFAPPPIPVLAPVQAPVSILPVALACAAILQVLITTLGLCADAVSGFKPDSRYQPSTGSFSTPRLASLLDLPHAVVRVASSTVVGLLLVAARADVAGALRADATGASAALLDVRGGAAVRLVSVGARWGLWDP